MKFSYGDAVMLIDAKGRKKLIHLVKGDRYFSHAGAINHDDLVDVSDASIVETDKGMKYLAISPLLRDYSLSMRRGATIVYPKDAAMIIGYADLQPGSRVLEAGVGSGALAASILRAIGSEGYLVSYERRAEFAELAQKNVETFFQKKLSNWSVVVGDVSECTRNEFTHLILDMLEPWVAFKSIHRNLTPGGVACIYVATTTQLSAMVETIRSLGSFTEPEAFETILRPWHLDGLAVRPEHRMNGHTGFLVITRKLADGSAPFVRRRKFSSEGEHD